MHLKTPVRMAFAALLPLAAARAMLKILEIDTLTGFYSRGNILGAVFNGVMLLLLGLLALRSLTAKEQSDCSPHTRRIQEFFAACAGLVIAVCSALWFVAAARLPNEPMVNTLPKTLQLGIHLFGILAGLALIAVALLLLSGAKAEKRLAVLALLPPLWHAFYMILVFMGFRFTLYSSDELFGTLYLAATTLFFYYHAGVIARISPKPRYTAAAGLVMAVSGSVVALGQLAARAVLGSDIAGPALGQCILMLAISAYGFAFCGCSTNK